MARARKSTVKRSKVLMPVMCARGEMRSIGAKAKRLGFRFRSDFVLKACLEPQAIIEMEQKAAAPQQVA